MIITKTPFRISFFGGGTDYPIWYNKHGGKTISSTIDKYSYIVLKKLPNFLTINLELDTSTVRKLKIQNRLSIPRLEIHLIILKLNQV